MTGPLAWLLWLPVVLVGGSQMSVQRFSLGIEPLPFCGNARASVVVKTPHSLSCPTGAVAQPKLPQDYLPSLKNVEFPQLLECLKLYPASECSVWDQGDQFGGSQVHMNFFEVPTNHLDEYTSGLHTVVGENLPLVPSEVSNVSSTSCMDVSATNSRNEVDLRMALFYTNLCMGYIHVHRPSIDATGANASTFVGSAVEIFSPQDEISVQISAEHGVVSADSPLPWKDSAQVVRQLMGGLVYSAPIGVGKIMDTITVSLEYDGQATQETFTIQAFKTTPTPTPIPTSTPTPTPTGTHDPTPSATTSPSVTVAAESVDTTPPHAVNSSVFQAVVAGSAATFDKSSFQSGIASGLDDVEPQQVAVLSVKDVNTTAAHKMHVLAAGVEVIFQITGLAPERSASISDQVVSMASTNSLPGLDFIEVPRRFEDKCGNGVLLPPEECDDGNVMPEDGCGATCLVESEWICTSQAAETSICSKIVPVNVPVEAANTGMIAGIVIGVVVLIAIVALASIVAIKMIRRSKESRVMDSRPVSVSSSAAMGSETTNESNFGLLARHQQGQRQGDDVEDPKGPSNERRNPVDQAFI